MSIGAPNAGDPGSAEPGPRPKERFPRADAYLVRACLEGDADAWQMLIERYARLVYSIAMKTGLSADDAADVLQLVSVSLLDHLADLRDTERLLPWISTTARRHALRVLKRNSRVSTGLDWDDDQASGVEGRDDVLPDDLSAGLMALWDQQLVREAMARLPIRCRRLLELLFTADPPLSYAETADRLRLAPGSVGPTRARCLDRLRKALEDLGF